MQLEDGSAEVFGAELQKGNSVDVSGQKLAVSCSLDVMLGHVMGKCLLFAFCMLPWLCWSFGEMLVFCFLHAAMAVLVLG